MSAEVAQLLLDLEKNGGEGDHTPYSQDAIVEALKAKLIVVFASDKPFTNIKLTAAAGKAAVSTLQ